MTPDAEDKLFPGSALNCSFLAQSTHSLLCHEQKLFDPGAEQRNSADRSQKVRAQNSTGVTGPDNDHTPRSLCGPKISGPGSDLP